MLGLGRLGLLGLGDVLSGSGPGVLLTCFVKSVAKVVVGHNRVLNFAICVAGLA